MRIACVDGQPVVVEPAPAEGLGRSLSGLLDHPSCLTSAARRMCSVVSDWDRISAAIASEGTASLPEVDLAAGAWSAPVPRPGKIVAAPVNYRAHGIEMEMENTVEQLSVFLKAGTAVIGPGADVVLPFPDRRVDHEAELAVVIGRRARHLSRAEALGCVLGYTCLLDVTMRGDEERSARKSFDTFAPLGPWIVTAGEVGDPGGLRIRCWVNGDLRQDSTTADLIVDVAALVAHASGIMTLEPGDVVSTGTPAGVGPLAPGDVVAVEIERVGRLEVGVAAGWRR